MAVIDAGKGQVGFHQGTEYFEVRIVFQMGQFHEEIAE
jgi:hypothetical protein